VKLRCKHVPFLVAIAVLCVAIFPIALTASRQAHVDRVGPSAVWNADPAEVDQARQNCMQTQFPELGRCFVEGMKRLGASPEAVAFAHLTGNETYLRKFVPTGDPDIAFVRYPFRANTNDGCLLVNGYPNLINVDDLQKLPQEEMKKDAAYEALLATHPQTTLFPGDRGNADTVRSVPSSPGTKRVAVEYMLLDGCHACARVGVAWFRFEFDANGKYLGTHYWKLIANPGALR
jgi:hypothetical protein